MAVGGNVGGGITEGAAIGVIDAGGGVVASVAAGTVGSVVASVAAGTEAGVIAGVVVGVTGAAAEVVDGVVTGAAVEVTDGVVTAAAEVAAGVAACFESETLLVSVAEFRTSLSILGRILLRKLSISVACACIVKVRSIKSNSEIDLGRF